MAALLKKRALAEFSQVIQEEPIPLKRLRLVQQPQWHDILSLPTTATGQQVLNCLTEFEKRLPVGGESREHNIRILIDQLYKERDSGIRVKIVSLIGKLVKIPSQNNEMLIDDISSLIKTEDSNKVLSQLVETLMVIGISQPLSTKLHHNVLQQANLLLRNPSHLVRIKCLELIGCLGQPNQLLSDTVHSEGRLKVTAVLATYSSDPDPRVRSTALQAMINLHERGHNIEGSIYDQACSALCDDHECVRLSAVKLVWLLSNLFPENVVKVPNSEEELRLVDDAFAKLCNMVNDLSMKVRAEAAGLLGSLHLVSSKFLDQTLDKKLMSNMRRKRSAHERQKEHFETGEWSTGQKWADDAPKEQVDADSVNLMSSGACGAFVHGLEDEFYEVRNAAIDSLCELASQSAHFAVQCQDYLVDMFNDEIESVRLNAIHSLRKISHHIVLREDQVEIVLEILKDCSYDIREGLREMLCTVKLATTACLKTCMLSMLENLKRYPQDRCSVWRTMQHLGEQHSWLTLPIVPELLSCHPYFDTPEPDMDDPAYISILILVFNAAAHSPTMTALFPQHTHRHYHYLRDTLPKLVPNLQDLTNDESPDSSKSLERTKVFLKEILDKLACLEDSSKSSSQLVLHSTIRDVDRISEIEPQLSSEAKCLSMCLTCYKLLSQLQQFNSSSSSSFDKVVELTYHIEHLFMGLSSVDLSQVYQSRLRALAGQLCHRLEHTSGDDGQQLCRQFLQTLDALKSFFQTHNIVPSPMAQSLISNRTNLDESRPPSFTATIGPLMRSKLQLIRVNSDVKQAQAVIIEPAGTSDNPLKLTAGLTLAIPVNCELENIRDVNNIRVQVKYPDGTSQLIKPSPDAIKQQGVNRYRLMMNVLLSHTLWTEASHVQLSIVQSYSQSALLQESSAGDEHVIALSNPVKIYVATRQARR